MGGGGVMEPLLGFFYVTMFWKDFAFSLWCALQDEIYFMDCAIVALLGACDATI